MTTKQMEKISQTLEGIANKYEENSEENKTIELAARALWYLYRKMIFDEFLRDIEEGKRILSDEELLAVPKVPVEMVLKFAFDRTG